MKKIALVLMFLLTTAVLAEEIGTYYGLTLYKPFGYLSPRRPPAGARTVSLDDLRIEFSAKQVCGYTDWSTAVIAFPKKILSAEYWRDVGEEIKTKAINSVLAISGALPSMLACNASPTFCTILNRAEALAQANLKFTFDSCQMLEGLADKTKAQFESLRSCVQNDVNSKNKQPSAALDRCSVGNRDPGSVNSKDKAEQAKRNVQEKYNANKLTDKACSEHSYPSYTSSAHAYSISEYSCQWLKKVFPGITIEAGAQFRHGGTFSASPAEDAYDEHIEKTTTYLVALVDLMHDIRYGLRNYAGDGPKPKHIVVRHSAVLKTLGYRSDGKLVGICYPDDGNSCKNDISKLPPIYKLSSGTNLPSVMVTPEMLFEIVELISPKTSVTNEYKKGDSHIALALEPLIQSVSYTRAQDLSKDLIVRIKTGCKEPDMQSAAAQQDCEERLERLEQSQKNLEVRLESDRKHLSAQVQFYNEVFKMKGERVRVNGDKRSGFFDPVTEPNQVK